MKKVLPYLLLIIIAIGSILVILLGNKADVFSNLASSFEKEKTCQIDFVYESGDFKYEVKDKKKFEEFVKNYIPCQGGYFTLGDPYEVLGPFSFKSIKIIIDNLEHNNSMGDNIASWDYNFSNLDQFEIRVNVNGFSQLDNFESAFSSLLAFRLDEVVKYNNPTQRLDRQETNLNTKDEDIGLIRTTN